MSRSVLVLRATSGVLFLIQLVLGILFWIGQAMSLVQLHMMLGLLFVLALVAFAVAVARAGAPRGPAIGLALLAIVILVVGMMQMQWVPGPLHWTIRVLHLLLAMAAMAIVGRLTIMLRGGAPARG